MEGILKVTPDKLTTTANTFNSTNSQIQNLTQNMLNTVNSMNSTWQGEAATAYSAKFKSLEDDMQKMHRMIEEHVKDLNEMARNYQQAEQKNMADSNALAGDVIN